MDGCTRSTTRGEFSYLMRWESLIRHAASCISLFILCIILWFFIHVSHRSNKCVAVVIAAALYDPLPSIPSDRHLIQTVVNCCCCLQSCWFSNFCSALCSCKCLPKWSTVCWLVAYRGSPVVVVLYYARASFSLGDLLLLVCLLAEVLLLLLFCMMFMYMYHPKLWCDPLLLACNILVLLWMKLVCLLSQLMFFCCLESWCSYRSLCMMLVYVSFLEWSSVASTGSRPTVILYDVRTIVPSGVRLLAELVLLSLFLYDAPACIFPWSDVLLLAEVLLFGLSYVYVIWYVVI